MAWAAWVSGRSVDGRRMDMIDDAPIQNRMRSNLERGAPVDGMRCTSDHAGTYNHSHSDFPAIAGVTVVLGAGYVLVNTLVDILQVVADRRISL